MIASIKAMIHSYINKNSSLSLKPSNLSLLFNQLNFFPEHENYSENVVNSNYFDNDQNHLTLKIIEKGKQIFLGSSYHINTCLLNKNLEIFNTY